MRREARDERKLRMRIDQPISSACWGYLGSSEDPSSGNPWQQALWFPGKFQAAASDSQMGAPWHCFLFASSSGDSWGGRLLTLLQG